MIIYTNLDFKEEGIMNKTYIIKFQNINEDYQDDVEGNLEALFSDVVEFSESFEIKEVKQSKNIKI